MKKKKNEEDALVMRKFISVFSLDPIGIIVFDVQWLEYSRFANRSLYNLSDSLTTNEPNHHKITINTLYDTYSRISIT
ncbi:hypothetical protein BLOT_004762 [Blomia tropicalis]|nr:hypothetical protein BLOT_004762 [Blomia tropicalis]